MAWTRDQIVTVQIYRRAAELEEGDYRLLLKTETGAFSSREKSLTNWHFDRVMRELERKVEAKSGGNLAELPRQIRSLSHWRTGCRAEGKMDSRQKHKIFDSPDGVWVVLKAYLPEHERNTEYLAAIAAKANRCQVNSVWDLSTGQAHLLIEALKDKIKHEIRRRKKAADVAETTAEEDSRHVVTEIPF